MLFLPALLGALMPSPHVTAKGSASVAPELRRTSIPAMDARFARSTIPFSTLNEPSKAIEAVRSIAALVSKWGADEWSVFGQKPVSMEQVPLSDGVILNFSHNANPKLGWCDGSLEIRVMNTDGGILGTEQKAIVFTALGKQYRGHEDILYKLALDECRNGALSYGSELAWGMYPDSAEVARLAYYLELGRQQRFAGVSSSSSFRA